MGSQRSVASGMEQNARNQKAIGISNAADKAAQKELGIQKTVAGPVQGASSSVTGYMATNTGGNQMYGSAYNQARNQYLADQGMGTMTNGSFMPGVQTDQGLVFTSANRDIYNRTKQKDIPLSRQMYDSQQKFKQFLNLFIVCLWGGLPRWLGAPPPPPQGGLRRRQETYETHLSDRQGVGWSVFRCMGLALGVFCVG